MIVDYQQKFTVIDGIEVVFDKYRNEIGALVDNCKIVITNSDKSKTYIPVPPPIKVNTYTKSDPMLGDIENKYSIDDAKEVINNYLARR